MSNAIQILREILLKKSFNQNWASRKVAADSIFIISESDHYNVNFVITNYVFAKQLKPLSQSSYFALLNYDHLIAAISTFEKSSVVKAPLSPRPSAAPSIRYGETETPQGSFH